MKQRLLFEGLLPVRGAASGARAVRRVLVGLVVLGACAGSASLGVASGADRTSASPSSRWVITDLGTLGGSRSRYSVAAAINDRGQVVGFSDTNMKDERDGNGERIGHAFLWEKGRMRDLGTLGGPSSRASGINDRGQVVGCSTTRAGDTHAFLWQGGTMRDLGTPGGSYSCAASINNRGQVVGTTGPDPGGFAARHAFLWSRGKMTDLGSFGSFGSDAFAINAGGGIVAWRWPRNGFAEGLVWDNGRVVALGPRTAGMAINAPGSVAGAAPSKQSGAAGADHAFLWRGGSGTDLGTFGGKTSYAQGINDAGLVVGFSERACSRAGAYVARAFVWAAGKMTGLVGLAPRLDITGATDVNNRGQVVGYASSGGGPGCVPYPRNPQSKAVMWTQTR